MSKWIFSWSSRHLKNNIYQEHILRKKLVLLLTIKLDHRITVHCIIIINITIISRTSCQFVKIDFSIWKVYLGLNIRLLLFKINNVDKSFITEVIILSTHNPKSPWSVHFIWDCTWDIDISETLALFEKNFGSSVNMNCNNSSNWKI